jgi:hypothetical protein
MGIGQGDYFVSDTVLLTDRRSEVPTTAPLRCPRWGDLQPSLEETIQC